MEIIAHRGGKKFAPENTMAAFEYAREHEVDGIEIDVQWTKDKIPVIIHDDKIDRTTNDNGKVNAYSLSELQTLDCGGWFHSTYKEETIPTLSSVAMWASEKNVFLHIELKKQTGNQYEFVTACLEILQSSGLRSDQFVISSFFHPYLSTIKKINKEIQTALLSKRPILLIEYYMKKIQADAIHIRHNPLNALFYQSWANKNIVVRVYNVISEGDVAICRKKSVKGIISDDFKMVRALLQEERIDKTLIK